MGVVVGHGILQGISYKRSEALPEGSSCLPDIEQFSSANWLNSVNTGVIWEKYKGFFVPEVNPGAPVKAIPVFFKAFQVQHSPYRSLEAVKQFQVNYIFYVFLKP